MDTGGGDVGEAEEGGRAVRPGQQLAGVLPDRVDPLERLADDERREPGRGEHVVPAEAPLDRRPALGQRSRVGDQAVLAVCAGHRVRDPPMPQVEQVPRGVPGTFPVGDVDAGVPLDGGLVDEDHRQFAPAQPGDRGRGRVAGVDQRAVHRHVACGDQVTGAGRGEQRDGQAGRGQLVGDRAEEAAGDQVGEGVAQRVGEQDADRAGGALGEGPGGRVGPGVTQLLCRVQDAFAQRGGELIGPGERVGDRHPADADPVRDGLQRHSRHRPPSPLRTQTVGRAASGSGVPPAGRWPGARRTYRMRASGR